MFTTKREGRITQDPATLEIGSSAMQSLFGEDIAPLMESLEDLYTRGFITKDQMNEILEILIRGN